MVNSFWVEPGVKFRSPDWDSRTASPTDTSRTVQPIRASRGKPGMAGTGAAAFADGAADLPKDGAAETRVRDSANNAADFDINALRLWGRGDTDVNLDIWNIR